jgi:hypothetical protein
VVFRSRRARAPSKSFSRCSTRRKIRRRWLQGFRRSARRRRVVVNALSEWLVAQYTRREYLRDALFPCEITQELQIVGKTDRMGTTVTFKPDAQVFDETAFNYDTLLTRMREQAFLNAGLRIRIIDERPGREPGRDALRRRHS